MQASVRSAEVGTGARAVGLDAVLSVGHWGRPRRWEIALSWRLNAATARPNDIATSKLSRALVKRLRIWFLPLPSN